MNGAGTLAAKVQLKPLAHQIIVITGASSGIGLCTHRPDGGQATGAPGAQLPK